MKSKIALFTIALAGAACAAWTPKDSATDYPTMTTPTSGDAIPVWNAETDATQQIFWSTFTGIFQGLDTDLTTIAGLTDPNADRILFWDDSAGAYAQLALGTNLSISGTTLNASGGGGSFDSTTVDATTWSDGANASNVWTFDLSGTDPTLTFASGIITVGGNFAITGSFTTSSIAVSGALTAGSFEFEGSTDDAFETTLGAVDPTADNAINLPNASGTVSLESSSAGTHAAPNTGAETPTWTGTTHVVWQGDAATINLPAAAGYANRGIIIYSTASSILTIEPNASEVIVRDGTAQTGGVNFTLSAAAGNYVALISDGTRWITLGFKGTLSVGS